MPIPARSMADQPEQSAAPFPKVLAGIFVAVTPATGGQTLFAPILAAMRTDTCQSAGNARCAGAKIAGITVQIPYELSDVDPKGTSGPPEVRLKVIEDGVSSAELLARVFPSRVHFIAGRHALALDTIDGIAIGASVFHADGIPVSPGLPARPGETLTVYGYGFGKPDAPLPTGEAASVASPVPMRGNLHFSLLLPEQPDFVAASNYPLSRYVTYFGVTPGTIGVYQMNFVLPEAMQGTRPCDQSTPADVVVTYTEYTDASMFAFCVQPL
jgi:uncharacterized protein (TIGR03437 family)